VPLKIKEDTDIKIKENFGSFPPPCEDHKDKM
jgi:hypothetical protein